MVQENNKNILMRKSHVVPLEVKKFLGQSLVLRNSYHQELRVSFSSVSNKKMLKTATLGNNFIHFNSP